MNKSSASRDKSDGVKKPASAPKAPERKYFFSCPSPESLDFAPHSSVGDSAVRKLLDAGLIRAKLSVGSPGDIFETEADRTAERVMRMSLPVCPECPEREEKEEQLRTKSISSQVTPEDLSERTARKEISAKEALNQSPAFTPRLESRIHSLNGSGHLLSDSTRTFFEMRFGVNFSQVRIHTNFQAAEIAQSMKARAFTLGQDIVFGTGQYAPQTYGGNFLIAHELAHVVQQSARQSIIQRYFSDDITQMSITREYAQTLTDTELQDQINTLRAQLLEMDPNDERYNALQTNLGVLEAEVSRRSGTAEGVTEYSLEEARLSYRTACDQLMEQRPYFDPNSSQFNQYCLAHERLVSLTDEPVGEPEGISLAPRQIIVVDETGQVSIIPDSGVAEIGDDLLPILDGLIAGSQGAPLPELSLGPLDQALVWNDGRAVLVPPVSASLEELLIQGSPAEIESAFSVTGLEANWERLQESTIHGALTSGIYQLGTYPISRFMGVTLPPGSRIRFADPFFAGESRLVTIFEQGTKHFYAWDAHGPVGATPHSFYHINQGGMHGLFGQSNHVPIPPAHIPQARALRYIKIGGRVFLVVGVFVDSYTLTSSVIESVERGTPRPAIAQAVRTVGGWGGAWAGAKLLCGGTAAGGALVGVSETGIGAVLLCLGGGLVGGIAGYFGADWIADMIEPD